MWCSISRLASIPAGFTTAFREFSKHGNATLLARTSQACYKSDRQIDTFGQAYYQGKRIPEKTQWNDKEGTSRSGISNSSAKTKTCHKCGEVGHISRACPTSRTYERASHNSSDKKERWSTEESNANLSEIGVPSKWKVGTGFQQYAEELRGKVKKYSDFSKKSAKRSPTIERRPAVKQDPGIRRQARLMKIEQDSVEEDELDNEVDVMKSHKIYDDHVADRAALKEQIKLRIVKKKYFREPEGESTERKLSWSEKEQIRHLYSTDPQAWNFEIIAEHFNIDVKVAKAVATASWQPSKPKPGEDIGPNIVEEEIFPLVPAGASGMEDKETEPAMPFPKRSTKKIVTWNELTGDSRKTVRDDQSNGLITTEKAGSPAMHQTVQPLKDEIDSVSAPDDELVLKYLSSEGSLHKWKKQDSRSPQLKVDHDSETTYYYDAKHGYQHPLGKPDNISNELPTTSEDHGVPMVKENDHLYRKGDSFYTEEGEFLYRVPGLQK